MANPKNRETVEEALRTELERDRTKTYVVEISPLGLVEMTRQNVTDGPREILTNRCPVCAGDGIVVSDATHALEIERQAPRDRARARGCRRSRSRCTRACWRSSSAPGGARLEGVEAASRRRFFLVPAAENGHVHLDHFEVLAQGKLDDAAPGRTGRGGRDDRAEARRARPPRPDDRRRQARRRLRGRRRGRVEARRQEGEGRPSGACSKASPTRRCVDDAAAAPTPITFEAEAEKPDARVEEQEGRREPAEADAGGVDELDDADGRTTPPIEDDAAVSRRSGDVVVGRGGRPAQEEADAPRDARRARAARSRRPRASPQTRDDDAHCGRAATAVRAPRIHVPPSRPRRRPRSSRRTGDRFARRCGLSPSRGCRGRGVSAPTVAEAQARAPWIARRQETRGSRPQTGDRTTSATRGSQPARRVGRGCATRSLRSTFRCQSGSTTSTRVPRLVRYHAASLRAACSPRSPEEAMTLRDHQGCRKAVPRPRGRAAARRPAPRGRWRDVHADRAARRAGTARPARAGSSVS